MTLGFARGTVGHVQVGTPRADGEAGRPLHSGQETNGEGSHETAASEFDPARARRPTQDRPHVPASDPPLDEDLD